MRDTVKHFMTILFKKIEGNIISILFENYEHWHIHICHICIIKRLYWYRNIFGIKLQELCTIKNVQKY